VLDVGLCCFRRNYVASMINMRAPSSSEESPVKIFIVKYSGCTQFVPTYFCHFCFEQQYTTDRFNNMQT
jgi:hypothetical protein